MGRVGRVVEPLGDLSVGIANERTKKKPFKMVQIHALYIIWLATLSAKR